MPIRLGSTPVTFAPGWWAAGCSVLFVWGHGEHGEQDGVLGCPGMQISEATFKLVWELPVGTEDGEVKGKEDGQPPVRGAGKRVTGSLMSNLVLQIKWSKKQAFSQISPCWRIFYSASS